MGQWWQEEAAAQSGGELGDLWSRGWTLGSSNWEALVFFVRGALQERGQRGTDFLNHTGKEWSLEGRRVGQTPCSSAGEMMESSVNPKE